MEHVWKSFVLNLSIVNMKIPLRSFACSPICFCFSFEIRHSRPICGPDLRNRRGLQLQKEKKIKSRREKVRLETVSTSANFPSSACSFYHATIFHYVAFTFPTAKQSRDICNNSRLLFDISIIEISWLSFFCLDRSKSFVFVFTAPVKCQAFSSNLRRSNLFCLFTRFSRFDWAKKPPKDFSITSSSRESTFSIFGSPCEGNYAIVCIWDKLERGASWSIITWCAAMSSVFVNELNGGEEFRGANIMS